MDKDKILDYVMNSPANTNPNVLKTMLNSGGSGGGGTEPLIVNKNTSQEGEFIVNTLDKTWKEIRDAFPNVCIHTFADDADIWFLVKQIIADESLERPYTVQDVRDNIYKAGSENGYPTDKDDGDIH